MVQKTPITPIVLREETLSDEKPNYDSKKFKKEDSDRDQRRRESARDSRENEPSLNNKSPSSLCHRNKKRHSPMPSERSRLEKDDSKRRKSRSNSRDKRRSKKSSRSPRRKDSRKKSTSPHGDKVKRQAKNKSPQRSVDISTPLPADKKLPVSDSPKIIFKPLPQKDKSPIKPTHENGGTMKKEQSVSVESSLSKNEGSGNKAPNSRRIQRESRSRSRDSDRRRRDARDESKDQKRYYRSPRRTSSDRKERRSRERKSKERQSRNEVRKIHGHAEDLVINAIKR